MATSISIISNTNIININADRSPFPVSTPIVLNTTIDGTSFNDKETYDVYPKEYGAVKSTNGVLLIIMKQAKTSSTASIFGLRVYSVVENGYALKITYPSTGINKNIMKVDFCIGKTCFPFTGSIFWNVMTGTDVNNTFREAFKDFIDTTVNGKKLTRSTFKGRTKTIDFDFVGEISQNVNPYEIGIFSLKLYYSKQGTTTVQGSVTGSGGAGGVVSVI